MGLKRPNGFQLRLETIDRYLNSIGELPEFISLQDSTISPISGILEMLYVAVDSIHAIEIVEKYHDCEFKGVE